ncbi:hypothetical protein R5R35_007322 [Gryllus longicercus]|uniref:Uncharacterized protein n=1 Tax=Gryllus longicercus TaxID=2509291 RepID=A0AAN9VIP5_9ORTH
MSMPKGKHQGGQTQGYSQHYPRTTSFVSRSTTPQQRPDVSFHVAATAFPPQQGGGAAPPGGPQLRGLHHPHHRANPPLPPAHQQQPPPPNNNQHSGGPPGPAPTSTPPGPADMGKQGPPHLQGQPQIPQGGQMQLNFGVPNQTRPNQSQPYFTGPRGPTPRMPNHRGQVVNMSTNNVGQQIFPSHVPIQQMQMYPVSPINPSQMFVPSQMQMFSAAGSRHQGGGTNYFPSPAGQQLMMPQQIPYQGFQPSQSFFYQGVRGAGMAGAPGGVGPGLAAGASQTVVVSGAPPPMGQTGQVSMMPIASTNVMGVTGLAGDSGTPSGPVSSSSSSGSKQTRRKHALDIVDPKTMKNVDIYESSGSSTPPRSGDSSARETPQPSAGSGQLDVAAEFAARVAKAASEESSGPPTSQVQFSEPVSVGAPQQVININGPEHVTLNSISPSSDSVLNQSDTSVSKPPIVLDEQISSWKQTQPKASSIGNKINSNSKGSKNESSLGKIEDQGTLNLEADNLVKQELERERSVPLGVPSVSVKDVTVSQSDLPVATSLVGQPVIPIGVVKDHSPSVLGVDPSLTPVVSAITNSPDIELHPRSSNREQYPGLKSSTPAHSSPRRKPRVPENIPGEKVVSPSLPVMSSIPPVTATVTQVSSSSGITLPSSTDSKPREHTPAPTVVTTESKLPPSLPPAKKTTSGPEQPSQIIEESVFIASAPKERREDKASRGRDRSSQGKEGIEKTREKSQGRDRDKPTVSRSRENPAPVAAVVSGPPPISVEPSPASRGTGKTPVVSPLEEVAKHQTNGEATDTMEGKASQQRSKHKRGQQKKELNRKGAEKEGTEMDAFAEPSAPSIPVTADSTTTPVSPPVTAAVSTAPAATPVSARPPSPIQTPTIVPASVVASAPPAAVSTASSVTSQQTTPSVVVTSTPSISVTSAPSTLPTVVSPASSLPNTASSSVSNNSVLSSTNKMADNIEVKNEELDETAKEEEEKIVAARNEENVKVSAVNSEKPSLIEQTAPAKTASAPKFNYREDQWSPNNQDGKKKYERDFLMSLKNEPLSKMKPNILPDLEIVLKDPRPARSLDITRGSHDTFTPKFMSSQGQSSRGGVPPKRGSQQGKAKSGKPQGVIHVTLSLKEEVKLRETENAWKPGRMKPSETAEEDAKTEDLYKRVRGVLNKLTPQKFNTLVEQVRTLPIDTKDKLQGVINLVFDKAIDEPGFSVAYALMCKVLSNIQVPADKDESNKEENQQVEYVNFRKLIVNRCQQEFEKNTEAELNKEQRLKEIAETKDPEKRKELQAQFEEESRKLRMKSVGNIRFIGELFKLHMLTTNIMHRCIRQLLSDGDEESLECLCKLLTTIGRDLESKKQDLGPYFERMKQVSQKRGEISSRVRFMLQDVIELRQHKWVPRRDDLNPKTIDQINKEAEKEAVEQAMNSGPSSGPRFKSDDRGGDRKKNRGPNEDGWSMAGRAKNYTVDTTRLKPKVMESDTLSLGCRSTYTNWTANSKAADTSKKNASPVISNNSFAALSDMPSEEKRGSGLSSRPGGKIAPSASAEKERMLAGFKSTAEDLRPQSHLQQSRSSSRDNAPRNVEDVHSGTGLNARLGPSAPNEDSLRGTSPDTSVFPSDVPPMSEDTVKKHTLVLVEEYLTNLNEKETCSSVLEIFGEANVNAFVLESINGVLEKTSLARQNVGKLMCYLMKAGVVSKQMLFTSFSQIISDGDDLAIDIPKIWLYLAEIIVPPLSLEIITFSEFRNLAKRVGKLVAEVLQLLLKDKGPAWIRERWDAAGLSWTDFVSADNVDSFVKKHKLEFTIGAGGACVTPVSPLSMEEVQKKLVQFLKPEQGTAHSFDQICDWIGMNVGERVSDPMFIRALMTALCESAVSQSANSIKLKDDVLLQHSKFFQKYIDNKEECELHCLYAVQAFVHRLEHPQGLICSIFHLLWENNFISSESFATWESSKEALAHVGKGVALKSLTTFFTALREGEDESEES